MAAKDVTEAELAVLQTLWDLGDSSVKQLVERMHPRGGNSEYATVQKLCERLRDKELVEEDRSDRPRRFRPLVRREDLIDRRLHAVAEDLCAGTYFPLVSQLLQGGDYTSEQIEALRRQVAALDEARRRPAPGDAEEPS